MIEQVAFCMYPVKDLQRARQFYEEVLGLTPGLMTEVWVEYALPGIGSLALFATDGIRPSHRAGGSVALQVKDLEQCTTELKAKGVHFLTDAPIQSEISLMQPIIDSEGNGLMLIEMLASTEESLTEEPPMAEVIVESVSPADSPAEAAETAQPAESVAEEAPVETSHVEDPSVDEYVSELLPEEDPELPA